MYGMTPFEKKTYDLFSAFHDFEDDFFNNSSSLPNFRTDIKDEGEKYVLEAELPGFDKSDIKLDLNGDSLVITAEHSDSKEEKDDDGKYIRRERYSGTCSRSFYVGEDVEQGDIKAKFENGILGIFVPKKEAKPKVEENKYISIEG